MNIPKVGDGATLCVGSDCYPYTIIEVSPDGNYVVVQEDNHTPTADCNYFGNQSYTYSTNPRGGIREFTRRKDGRYHAIGQSMKSSSLSIGARRYYQDPSF